MIIHHTIEYMILFFEFCVNRFHMGPFKGPPIKKEREEGLHQNN